MGRLVAKRQHRIGNCRGCRVGFPANVAGVAAQIVVNTTRARADDVPVARQANVVGSQPHASEANQSAASLISATEDMDNIVQVINKIASQINLLALNATIEAARAGEAGKGFAVVASEVKELATQTTEATQQISKEIGSVQNVSESVGTILQTVSSSISDINEKVTEIAAAVEEQTAVTQEISENMQHASDSASNATREIEQQFEMMALK